MTNGAVKFYNSAKGFGFITSDGDGKDVFVPANSLVSSGISNLKAGQRISFETEPSGKGPKAVNLKVLADLQPLKAVKKHPALLTKDAGTPTLTIFRDPASEESDIVLAAVRAAGYNPRIIDYLATPPTRDELKNLTILLRGGDQSLVRRYDPLFHELRLDDRFISENDFLAAIVEHPSLINGPILATVHKARRCLSENEVKSFLGIELPDESRMMTKPKGVPKRIAATIKGDVASVSATKVEKVEEDCRAERKRTKKVREKRKATVPKASNLQTKTKPKTKPKTKKTTTGTKSATRVVRRSVRNTPAR